MGSGCIYVNIDVDADIPPTVDVSVDADMPLSPAEPSEDIIVTEPLMNQEVGDSFEVTGEGRVFEQVLNWRLTDLGSGESIEDFANTNAADIGLFGPFSFTVEVPETYSDELLLEVFEYSAADGSQVNTVEVPLVR